MVSCAGSGQAYFSQRFGELEIMDGQRELGSGQAAVFFVGNRLVSARSMAFRSVRVVELGFDFEMHESLTFRREHGVLSL